MSTIAIDRPTPAIEDIAAYKRIATEERAEAIRDIGRAVSAWLRDGLKLRYSDDAITHPAAGAPCGC